MPGEVTASSEARPVQLGGQCVEKAWAQSAGAAVLAAARGARPCLLWRPARAGGKEGGTLTRHLRLLPRLPRPAALLHGRRLDGDVRHLHPAADLRAREWRRRQQGDPGPGQEPAEDHQRRQDLHAHPAPRASNTPTARRSRPPTSPTRSNGCSSSTPAARPSTPTSSAPKSSPKTKKGGIPGIKTDDKTGKIVIDLIKPRGTFTNELGLMFVAPVPADTPNEDRSANPPPGHRALRDHQVRAGHAAGTTNATRSGRRPTRRLMPELPSGHVDKIDITVIRNHVDPGQRRRTGQVRLDAEPATRRPLRRSEGASTKARQFRIEPTISTYYFWMNTTQAAVQRPQGPPGGQLRDRHRSAGTDLRRRRSPPPSRSCRRGCPATRSSSSTPTTWPRRRR